VTPWRANVREGLLYTYGIKSKMQEAQTMSIYITYDDDSKKLLMSIVKEIFDKDGNLRAIASLLLTDFDLDAVPDVVIYTSHFFDGRGNRMTSLNVPAAVPIVSDMQAWQEWLLVLFNHVDAAMVDMNNVDPDA
jgi:hypothetical protein